MIFYTRKHDPERNIPRTLNWRKASSNQDGSRRGWNCATRPRYPGSGRLDGKVAMGGVVVEDHVDDLADRDLRLDGVEEADELLMPVAPHVAAGSVEDVERGE